MFNEKNNDQLLPQLFGNRLCNRVNYPVESVRAGGGVLERTIVYFRRTERKCLDFENDFRFDCRNVNQQYLSKVLFCLHPSARFNFSKFQTIYSLVNDVTVDAYSFAFS